jgi:hypothetical protein
VRMHVQGKGLHGDLLQDTLSQLVVLLCCSPLGPCYLMACKAPHKAGEPFKRPVVQDGGLLTR